MDACLDLSGADPDQAARTLSEALGEPADVVFEAAGSPAMLEASLRAVRTGGVVLAMGLIKGAHSLSFADYMHDFAMREIEIRTTYAYTREDFPPSIGMFAAGRLDVRPLIDRLVPLSDLQTAFELAIRPDTYRVVVTP